MEGGGGGGGGPGSGRGCVGMKGSWTWTKNWVYCENAKERSGVRWRGCCSGMSVGVWGFGECEPKIEGICKCT